MSTPELDAMLVKNLADLDSSVKHLDRIETEVHKTMDQVAETWAEEHEWKGEYAYKEVGLWVAPSDWQAHEVEEDEHPYFSIQVGAGDTEAYVKDDEDFFYLTRLCGLGFGQLGFVFEPVILKTSKFKKILKDIGPLLEGTGFAVDADYRIFLPFKLDVAALSEAIKEEDIESAFGPFKAALEQLKSAKPAFDKIIEKIKKAETAA